MLLSNVRVRTSLYLVSVGRELWSRGEEPETRRAAKRAAKRSRGHFLQKIFPIDTNRSGHGLANFLRLLGGGRLCVRNRYFWRRVP